MTFLEDRDLQDVPSIKEYYKGKTIFITGGSGFMGKVLIEKLLYSCTDLKRIYLLLRSKRGVKSEDRLAALYESSCFGRLRKRKPGVFEEKVSIIPGDIGSLELGIANDDKALLINEVNIVFHVAASVRFNDPLDKAMKINVRGTREMVELAKEMKHLESFIHVSTGYSNANRDTIEEVMYPPHADWRDTLKICETVDSPTLDILTPKYLGELPNTYVYTKQLAEHVVYENRGILPAVILRPTIVVSTHKEPFPGWHENFYGPIGLMVAFAKGVIQMCYTDPDAISDCLPVDLAIKNFIAASWIRGTKRLEQTDDIPVYNVCSGSLNRIRYYDMQSMSLKAMREIPLDNTLWETRGTMSKSRFQFYWSVILEQLIPALFVDAILLLLKKKPRLIKTQRQIYSVQIALEYFSTRSWTFCNDNYIRLSNTTKYLDKAEFYDDIAAIDQEEFIKNTAYGSRKYVLGEKDEDIPKAKIHLRRIQILQKICRGLFFIFVVWLMWNTAVVQRTRNIIYKFERSI